MTAYSNYTSGFGSSILMATTTYSGGAFTVGTYVKVAQSKDLKSPEPEVGDIKITNNDSPNNSKEYRPGMIEPGETEFDWIYFPSQQATLYATLGDGNIYGWKEVFPDGSNCVWLGYIKKIGIETKTEDEAITGKVTIKAINKMVYSAS